MKRKYESPAMQEEYAEVISELLAATNINPDPNPHPGDAKESAWEIWKDEE